MLNEYKFYNLYNIIEKYEKVFNYLYPIAQNIPRNHGILKKEFISTLIKQIQLFNEAGKSNQISRIYLSDAGLSNIKFFLRFIASKNIKCLTHKQQAYSQKLISECADLLDTLSSYKKVKWGNIHAVKLGGNWNNTSNSGSRNSNWNNSPTNSNNNIGSRGVVSIELTSLI